MLVLQVKRSKKQFMVRLVEKDNNKVQLSSERLKNHVDAVTRCEAIRAGINAGTPIEDLTGIKPKP
jgi:hypothetical protein